MLVSKITGVSQTFSSFSKKMNSSVTPWSHIILATSVTALAGIGIYHWTHKNDPFEEGEGLSTKVKERICRTYGYIFGGLTLTAATAVVSHVSGLSLKIFQNKAFVLPAIMVVSIGSLIGTICVDKKNVKIKHAALAIFNVSMGMMLSPLGFLDKALVGQAALISLGVGSLLSLGAYLAPSKSFLSWESPILTALSTISFASAISVFFPRSAFAYGMDRISLYGGLLLYSGLMMSNTQKLLKDAEEQNDYAFDPIAASLNIYMDSVNIFLRILRILAEEKYKEEKE